MFYCTITDNKGMWGILEKARIPTNADRIVFMMPCSPGEADLIDVSGIPQTETLRHLVSQRVVLKGPDAFRDGRILVDAQSLWLNWNAYANSLLPRLSNMPEKERKRRELRLALMNAALRLWGTERGLL